MVCRPRKTAFYVNEERPDFVTLFAQLELPMSRRFKGHEATYLLQNPGANPVFDAVIVERGFGVIWYGDLEMTNNGPDSYKGNNKHIVNVASFLLNKELIVVRAKDFSYHELATDYLYYSRLKRQAIYVADVN